MYFAILLSSTHLSVSAQSFGVVVDDTAMRRNAGRVRHLVGEGLVARGGELHPLQRGSCVFVGEVSLECRGQTDGVGRRADRRERAGASGRQLEGNEPALPSFATGITLAGVAAVARRPLIASVSAAALVFVAATGR